MVELSAIFSFESANVLSLEGLKSATSTPFGCIETHFFFQRPCRTAVFVAA